jgi:hypothetical protein
VKGPTVAVRRRSTVSHPDARVPRCSHAQSCPSDRYLRHANYLLRIDVLGAGSPATDRADATFRVGY